MKKLFCTLLLLLACFCVQAQTVKKGQVLNYTLSWDANSEPDMSHYIVYWGTESRKYTQNSGNIGLTTTYNGSITNNKDELKTFYFAVTAVDTSGLESEYSNEVTVTLDSRVAPAPPKNLTWIERLVKWFKATFKRWT